MGRLSDTEGVALLLGQCGVSLSPRSPDAKTIYPLSGAGLYGGSVFGRWRCLQLEPGGSPFARAVCILDFYHASQHLWDLGRLLYRQDDPSDKAKGEGWVQQRLESLKTKGPKPLLCALKRRQAATKEARESLRKARHDFQENACRMDSPAHLKAGRRIGSGAVEAECKCVVGMRLKQAGMRWSDKGADAVLAVRTTLLNAETDRLSELARAA